MLTISVLILAGMAASAGDDPATPPPADVRPLYESLRRSLTRVDSVEYAAKSVMSMTAKGAPVGSITYRLKFKLKGDKYLSQFTLKNSTTNESMDKTVTFDGGRYQDYNGEAAHLVEAKQLEINRPYGSPQVANSMFQFFAYGPADQVSYDALKEGRIWDALAGRSKAVGRGVVRGHPCVVVEIAPTASEPDIKTTVHFAEDLDYYPVRVEQSGTKGSYRGEVAEARSFPGDAGPVIVPVRIEEDMVEAKPFGGPGTDSPGDASKVVTEVDPASLKVNAPIDDSAMKVPVSQAHIFMDQIAGIVYRDGVRQAEARPKVEGGWPFWLLLLNVGVVAAIIYAGRRFGRRRAAGLTQA